MTPTAACSAADAHPLSATPMRRCHCRCHSTDGGRRAGGVRGRRPVTMPPWAPAPAPAARSRRCTPPAESCRRRRSRGWHAPRRRRRAPRPPLCRRCPATDGRPWWGRGSRRQIFPTDAAAPLETSWGPPWRRMPTTFAHRWSYASARTVVSCPRCPAPQLRPARQPCWTVNRPAAAPAAACPLPASIPAGTLPPQTDCASGTTAPAQISTAGSLHPPLHHVPDPSCAAKRCARPQAGCYRSHSLSVSLHPMWQQTDADDDTTPNLPAHLQHPLAAAAAAEVGLPPWEVGVV
mmetsp:Transcript_11365/g.20546  ORF Transcript_11365/g.20546 Transcript_11365/m.20546 type:complete len:292 (-) Transcript_11365:354-1229(-)